MLRTLLVLSLVGGAASAPAPLTLLEYPATVPSTWVSRPPVSTMRLAEFTVSGGDGAEVVVYFFGKGQGGNVEANLTRWKSQFSNPDGSPVSEKISRDSTGAFPITIAEYRGTYARGIGAGSTENAKPNQGLTAAIIETPKGTLFVQLFGPAARVAAERETLVKFVKSVRP